MTASTNAEPTERDLLLRKQRGEQIDIINARYAPLLEYAESRQVRRGLERKKMKEIFAVNQSL